MVTGLKKRRNTALNDCISVVQTQSDDVKYYVNVD